jgi:hypothetical protein
MFQAICEADMIAPLCGKERCPQKLNRWICIHILVSFIGAGPSLTTVCSINLLASNIAHNIFFFVFRKHLVPVTMPQMKFKIKTNCNSVKVELVVLKRSNWAFVVSHWPEKWTRTLTAWQTPSSMKVYNMQTTLHTGYREIIRSILKSRATAFYTHLLNLHVCDKLVSQNNLVCRTRHVCAKYNI